MLLRPIIILTGFFLSQVLSADLISSTESNEFGAYVNPNPKNICVCEHLLEFLKSQILINNRKVKSLIL